MAGFELGIQRAYSNQQTTQVEQDWQGWHGNSDEAGHDVYNRSASPLCIGYSEIDKYAIKVYERRFNGHTNFGDATRIDPTELPDFDLLVGGFPCQAFSIAGKRAGFSDTRGTLFFDIARILKDKRPRHLVLENVKGLLSHNKGKTFQTIIGVLSDLGYRVEWQVLNSKDFGVPQNRERIFIVGHLRGECGRKIFPILGSCSENPKLQRHIANTLTARYEGGQATGTYIGEGELNAQGKVKQIAQIYDNPHNSQAGRIYDKGGISPTLDVMGGGNRQPKVIVGSPKYVNGKRTVSHTLEDIVPTIRATQHKSGDNQPLILKAPNGKDVDLTEAPDYPTQLLEVRTEAGKESRREIRKTQGRDSTKRGKDEKKYIPKKEPVANALTTGQADIEKWVIDMPRIRRLTPRECERLQAFPDDWTKLGVGEEPISDTQRYKMCGNAVTVNVVEAVMTKLFSTCVDTP